MSVQGRSRLDPASPCNKHRSPPRGLPYYRAISIRIPVFFNFGGILVFLWRHLQAIESLSLQQAPLLICSPPRGSRTFSIQQANSSFFSSLSLLGNVLHPKKPIPQHLSLQFAIFLGNLASENLLIIDGT